jgi:hypothetical protein
MIQLSPIFGHSRSKLLGYKNLKVGVHWDLAYADRFHSLKANAV